MNPGICRMVVVMGTGVRGYTQPQVEQNPAVITRVHSGTCVNVTVLPDGGSPICKSSITLYADRAAADAHLQQCKEAASPFVPDCIAFWPDRV